MKKYQNKVNAAESLENLVSILRSISDELARDENEFRIDDFVNLAELPTFGNKPIKNTMEVFSWDDNNVLIVGHQCWEIEPRCGICGEATFHCKHEN